MFLSSSDRHTTVGCSQWDEWENYTPKMKEDLMSFAMSSMDSLHVCLWLCSVCVKFLRLTLTSQHWFFWTWKIGPSAIANSPRAPLWSYKLGLENGWIPHNPREANVRTTQCLMQSYAYAFQSVTGSLLSSRRRSGNLRWPVPAVSNWRSRCRYH
jgi:hypothetical protein